MTIPVSFQSVINLCVRAALGGPSKFGLVKVNFVVQTSTTPWIGTELAVKNTLQIFPACRKRRIKKLTISGLTASQFRNFTATDTSTTPAIGTDTTTTTFGYRKWEMIGSRNVHTLLDTDIESTEWVKIPPI